MELQVKKSNEFWLRLDNAAKIYPAIRSTELTSVFRISFFLKERIKAKPFFEAVQALENRFPYYKVKLKIGFFWFYLEHADLSMNIKPDLGEVCRTFNKGELLFRVLAKTNNISVEFSHMITDGTGALEFLRSLLLVYFEKCGLRIPSGLTFLRPEDEPAKEEYEDAYSRYLKKGPSSMIKVRKAFHLPFSLKKPPGFRVLTVILSLDQVKQRSRSYHVSLTEYFISVYLFSLQQIYENLTSGKKHRSNRICRIEVPVNLRKMFPSKTMRNFSLYVLPEIDLRLGHYTFEEIIKSVYHQMQLETDPKLINKEINRNVGSLNHPFIRRVPLFIKSFILSKTYSIGVNRYSGVITNLGRISFAPEINTFIDHFKFIPPPPNKTLKVNCGIAGFGDKIALSFGNITSSDELERIYLNFLRDQKLSVEVINEENKKL